MYRRLVRLTQFVAAHLLALMITALGYRLLRLTRTDRIGHLVGEIDCVVKEDKLAGAQGRKVLLLAPRNMVANRHLVGYWSRFLTIVEIPWLCRLLDLVCDAGLAVHRRDMFPYFTAINETAKYNEIYSRWAERGPLLSLDSRDIERGEAVLRQLGIPQGSPFVCFHSRDAGYSPQDEHWHSHRNAGIESYLPAMRALRERGLFGVRMGDPTMRPMSPSDGLVDYACSKMRSDWMDVFLCARCEFFLGNSSGVYLISTAFGRPSALANLVPMSTTLGGGSRELGIPKLLWSEQHGRHLTFPEVFSSPIANYRFAEEYAAQGIRVIESDPQDVTSLALEMLESTTGGARYDARDEQLQARFRALFRPGHYGYGSAARVGRDFLRRYSGLLD